MASFVSVPKDLSKIKSKVAMNMTKRQLICFGTAAVTGVPVYFLTRGALGNSAAVLIMVGIMAPFFLLAMYERDGLPAERILRNYIRAKFCWPGIRPYKSVNFYEKLSGQEGLYIAKTAAQSSKRTRKAPEPKHPAGKRKPQSREKRR